MKQIRISAAAAIAGLGALALFVTPSFAASDQGATKTGAPARFAHMGQGQGDQWRGLPCPMGMTGPGTKAPGKSGQGMMPPKGMLPPAMSGQSMMGPGVGKGPGHGSQVVPSKDPTANDVRQFLKHRLETHGNKRLKVGDVNKTDDLEALDQRAVDSGDVGLVTQC